MQTFIPVAWILKNLHYGKRKLMDINLRTEEKHNPRELGRWPVLF